MSGGTNLPGYGNLVLPLTGTQILAHFLGTIELTVSSLANPTELNAVGSDVPDWRLCKTVGAGTDGATLYRLDASSDSVNAPYVMASAVAGLRWVAIAGAYVNQEMAINGGVNLPSETASRIVTTDSSKDLDTPATVTTGQSLVLTAGTVQLDAETASRVVMTDGSKQLDTPASVSTGQAWSFTSTLTVVDGNFSITGSSDATKTIKFEVDAQAAGADLTIDAGAQTADRTVSLPVLTANATLAVLEETQTFTGAKTFSAATNFSNTTNATASTNGAVTIGNGTAATNVGIGGGRVNAGDRVIAPKLRTTGTEYSYTTGGGAVTPAVQTNDTGANGAALGSARWNSGGSAGSRWVLAKSSGAAVGTFAVVSANDSFGLVSFCGDDGTNFEEGARIAGECDGTPGNDDMPGRLVFLTTPDGSATPAERMRITNGGNVLINTAAIATTATDGFLYIPTCAGTPTGVPTSFTGRAPIVIDSTNNKLYFYSGGSWRDAGP